YPWTSSCSRRSPQKSGDRPTAAAGRVLPPGAVRCLRAPGLPRAGAAALDAAAAAEESHRGGRTAGGADVGVGEAAPALRLPAYLGVAAAGGLARQPQAGPPDLPPFYGPGAARVGSTVTDGSSGRRSAAASARGTIAPYSAGVRYPNEL